MKTLYRFDTSTAELVSEMVFRHGLFSSPGYTARTNFKLPPDTGITAVTIVCEGEYARREMMNHFGDDSSWPPGWWDRLTAPSVTFIPGPIRGWLS